MGTGTLLLDLEDDPLASALPGDDRGTPVATLPADVVLEDTQSFSQPLVDCWLSVYHSLPNPSHTGVEVPLKELWATGHGALGRGYRTQKQN